MKIGLRPQRRDDLGSIMRQRFTWKRFFQSHLFFAAGLVVLILLSISLTRAHLKDRAIRAEIASLQNEAETLEQDYESYKILLEFLGTSEFLEREARQSLGYARSGEQVVVIEQDEQEVGEELDLSKMSNPRKWWIYFFGP